MKLRAFDLSDRTIRRGRRPSYAVSRQRAFMIAQCSITVALAWLLARQLLGHVQSIVRFEGVDALIAGPALLRKFGITGRGDLSAAVRASELTAPPHR
jgi:2-keto-3-deoxy-L-rhamnonate aldolase RhmA